MRIEQKPLRGVRVVGSLSLALIAVLVLAGCQFGSDPTEPPQQPDIELIDQPAPPLPETTEYTEGKPTRLVAVVDLHGGRGLYLGEWPSLPASQITLCYFAFVSDYPEPDDPDPELTFCDEFSKPVHLWERGEYLRWPDVTLGTVDASIDEVRLTFEGKCGAQTYRANGPLLRSSPTRRVFMLDQSDSCLWKTAKRSRTALSSRPTRSPRLPETESVSRMKR